MEIEIFRPWEYTRSPIHIEELQAQIGKPLQYAPSGKASIYHLIRALGIRDKILIPAYLCASVLKPLRDLRVQPIFYDVDPGDLNASLESLDRFRRKESVHAVLVASLYGNPANLVEIERYCREHGVSMIDDGAQSFGATLEGRWVSAFGDGGFFSFSPGKATAGHAGAFFWSGRHYSFPSKQRAVSHRIRYFDFYLNRQRIDELKALNPIKSLFRYATRALDKWATDYDGKISGFEEPILGGILKALPSHRTRRIELIDEFWRRVSAPDLLIPIRAVRGNPSPHKIVMKTPSAEFRSALIRSLGDSGIYASSGYALLGGEGVDLPHSADAARRIVELPVEPDGKKMGFLADSILRLLGKRGKLW